MTDNVNLQDACDFQENIRKMPDSVSKHFGIYAADTGNVDFSLDGGKVKGRIDRVGRDTSIRLTLAPGTGFKYDRNFEINTQSKKITLRSALWNPNSWAFWEWPSRWLAGEDFFRAEAYNASDEPRTILITAANTNIVGVDLAKGEGGVMANLGAWAASFYSENVKEPKLTGWFGPWMMATSILTGGDSARKQYIKDKGNSFVLLEVPGTISPDAVEKGDPKFTRARSYVFSSWNVNRGVSINLFNAFMGDRSYIRGMNMKNTTDKIGYMVTATNNRTPS